jgi:hypothetical protein
MSTRRPLIAAAFLWHSFMPAQQFVETHPDNKHLYDEADRAIYQLSPDASVEKYSLPVPSDLKLFGRPRPKLRLDRFWISNGKRVYSRPLQMPSEASVDTGWEQAKLPEGIEQFCDFDIISDTEAIICGCSWKMREDNDKVPLRHDLHFLFDHKTGALTKTIETLDAKDFSNATPQEAVFGLLKASESYLCRFNSYIVIVGRWSGSVVVVDLQNGNTRKSIIVPSEEMPSDSEAAVNTGNAIAWVGPLDGDAALLCCRKWSLADQLRDKPVLSYCFRTLDLKTGKVALEGPLFRERRADADLTLFEDGGNLLSVRDAIDGRAK